MSIPDQFAHVLLFSCPECGAPLATACASARRNLEPAEGHWFNPHCHCGWTGDVMGVTAIKHWVEGWDQPVDSPAAACDGEPLH